jgi:hypothetical protein
MLFSSQYLHTQERAITIDFEESVELLCLHQGSLGQILFWTGFFEIVVGWPAMNATIEGSRIPGDFKFDPLGLGKKDFARMQVML